MLNERASSPKVTATPSLTCTTSASEDVVSDADVTQIAAQTMMVAAKVAAPVLLTALLVGFLISLFQAATQIQEPTLSFVPKMIAVAIALLVTGNWVLSELVSFTQSLFDQLPALLDRT